MENTSLSRIRQNDQFIHSIFRRFLIPTILSVLGGTVNVLVDNAIVGNMLGQDALAAINLCGPIMLLSCTVGTLIGSGAGFLSASLIGRDEEEQSRLCYSASVLGEIAAGLLLSVLGLVFLDEIIILLGADAALFPLAMDYGRIAFIGATAKCLLYIPFNFLRLEGRASVVSASFVAMTTLNGILDVVFIKMGMGMTGASIASVLGTCFGMAMGFVELHRLGYRVRLPKPMGGLVGKMLSLGTPFALNNLLETARLICLNRILIQAGGELWVAVFTVICSMSEFSLCFITGIPQTASPLVGIYCAERNNTSLRRLMRLQFIYGGLVVLPFSILTWTLCGPICALFGMELSQQAEMALRCFAISRPIAFATSALMIFFNASGKVDVANYITVCKAFVFAVLPAAVLVKAELPVWYFLPAAELLTLIALIPLLIRKSRGANTSRLLLLDETLDKQGRVLDFSVETTPDEITSASQQISAFCQANDFTPRQTMAVSLSIEEMLLLIAEHCFDGKGGNCDLRVFCVNGSIGLRIRNGGHMFNPLEWYRNNPDTSLGGESLGLQLISRLAHSITYKCTYGFNCLTILLEGSENHG